MYNANRKTMLRLFVSLLKDEDGYTPVECGILGCLTVIFAEKLVLNF
jgi:Flp pilus assembly pilin Flp